MNARAIDVVLDALRANGATVVERGGDRWAAQCPAHDDRNPSLSISPRRENDGVVVCCHAGCELCDILESIGLAKRDLFDEPRMRAAYAPRNTYSYSDGRKVHRKPGKQFHQSGNTKGTALFGAERIGDACLVYAVEGEKDVLAIEAAGGTAVCSAMGAGKAHLADWSALRGLDVVVVADRDDPGRRHAADVVALLDGIALSVRVVEAKAGKDAADHIAWGYTLAELVDIELGGDTGRQESDDTGQRRQDSDDVMPKLWRATDLKPAAQPHWLAKARIPRAAVSLLIGDEGIGKSLLWIWIAAAVTTGREAPEFGIPAGAPGHVIIAAITEDDWCTAVRPRLEIAGADLSMIRVICTDPDGSGAPVFPRDLELIRQADPRPDLIVVDAWLDTVPAGLKVRDPQQARLALHPWKDLATVTNAAISLICHTNRVATANARDRYGATIELRKKARMSLYCQADDNGRLIVGPEKANGAATVPASLFTIEAVPVFVPTADHDGTVPRLAAGGQSDQTASQHLAEAFAAGHDTNDSGGTAIAWLAIELASGPRWASDIYTAGELAGHGEDKLKRAKLKLHVESKRSGPTAWFWRLPQHRERTPDPSSAPSRPRALEPHSNFRESAPSSEERERVNAEKQANGCALEICQICNTKLLHPESITRGICEACWLSTSQQIDQHIRDMYDREA